MKPECHISFFPSRERAIIHHRHHRRQSIPSSARTGIDRLPPTTIPISILPQAHDSLSRVPIRSISTLHTANTHLLLMIQPRGRRRHHAGGIIPRVPSDGNCIAGRASPSSEAGGGFHLDLGVLVHSPGVGGEIWVDGVVGGGRGGGELGGRWW